MTDNPVRPITDPPVVTASRTKLFLQRHKPKIIGATAAIATGTVFVLGRRSRDVVESVDIDLNVEKPDTTVKKN